jgi:predicted nuclease of predicted toxin-antitoxin system
MARFKADENLPLRVVRLFRERGHDVHTVEDEALAGAPDPHVAAAARAEGRCVLSLDTDFADIRFFPPGVGPGIVVLRPGAQDAPTVQAVAEQLLIALEEQEVGHDLWIVDRNRIRVRGPRGS